MKKFYPLVFLILLTVVSQGQQTFSGNGKTGFGGTVGAGSLVISNDATTYNFSFTKGPGDLNDAVVVYIDSKTGGFGSTAGFNDNNDGLRTATSGYSSSTNKSVLTFPSGFLPDYAIAFDQGFAAIFELVNGGPVSFNYVGSANLTPTGTTNAVYNFTALKSQLSIVSDASFNFLVTYISTTAFRSNEFIGEAGPAGNLGFTDYTATTFNNYTGNVVPLLFSEYAVKKLNNSSIQIKWSTEQEINVSHFEIVRSLDGSSFSVIASVPPSTTNNAVKFYSFTDITPAKGYNYYKVIAVDKDGKKLSTDILKININPAKAQVAVFKPNPGKMLMLKISDLDKGNYEVKILNSNGQQVYTGKLIHHGINTTYSLPLVREQSLGIYRLVISNNNIRLVTSFISE